MSMSNVTNRQHYISAIDHLTRPDIPPPLQLQSSRLSFGIDSSPRNDGLGFLARPPADTARPANTAVRSPSAGGGFFGKLFGAIGNVFGKVGKVISSITGVLGPLASIVGPFFGPVGVAVSGAINIGGQVLRQVSDRLQDTMGQLKNLFKS